MISGLECVESRAMYEETNYLMEKIGKIVYITVVCVTVPGFVIPKAIVSYYRYYIINMGNDAFVLSIPTWYVYRII